jgi:hypothetical protein
MWYSSEKKNEILPFNNVDGIGAYYDKWNKVGTEGQTLYNLSCMWSYEVHLNIE